MKKTFSLLFAASFISGCTATGNTGNSKDGVSACTAAIKGSDFLIVDVPAADNFISNKMIVATVKSTGSNAMDSLVKTMSLSVRPAIIVVGDNEEVTAATLEAALLKLPKGTARSSRPVCFAGASEHETSLKAAADVVGIPFVMAPAK